MFHSKSNFKRGLQAFAGAFFLALVIAGGMGIMRVHAMEAATAAAMPATHGDSSLCSAGLQSSDDYLRQEEAVLRKVTQSNWNADQVASLSESNSCAADLHSSDYYLRQEEAVLRIVTQSNWNASEIASLGGSNFVAQASH